MNDRASAPRHSGLPSVSRSLQWLAIAVLVLIVGATIEQLAVVRAAAIADAKRQVSRLDMVFAEQTGRAVETVDFILRDAIDTLARLRAASPVDGDGYRQLLARRIAGVRQVAEIAIADAAGNVLYSSRPGPTGALPPVARKLVAAEAGRGDMELRFSDPMRDAGGRWTALMLRGIRTPDGRFAGAAIAYLNLGYFEDFYRAVELNENGAILLHLRDGTVLARYPHNDAVVGQSYADLPPFSDILAHEIAGTVIMNSPIDGNRRVLAIRALKAFPLAVNVSVSEKRVLAGWRRQTRIFSMTAAAALAAIVGLLLLLAQRSRQIEGLLGSNRAAREAAEEAHGRLLEQVEERGRAEAALRQAQRIEAVGQLTGGVAHDFNNLLTVLIGNIELIEAGAAGDTPFGERLRAMRAAAERGAMLTGHLLAFARRQPLLPRPIDLNAVVAGMQDLLQSALGGRITMATKLAPDLWPAMVDPTQIELVILNLVINARDAMPEGGVVTIETGHHRCGPPTRPEDPAEGDYVALRVIDSGGGMPPEVQARAFEPFFTTKPPGAGSGLGLSQVFGTARQSGGDVQIASVRGHGTTVTVYLPRAAASAEATPPRQAEPAAPRASQAVVLVVDDNDAVRSTTADILKGLGYGVLQAASGDAALDLLGQGGPIDVLLTDVIMSGISGPELARRARALHPLLPIVFISGYADPDGVIGGGLLHRLVRKPFRPADLQLQIEAALADARAPTA